MNYMLMICDEEAHQTGPGDPGFEDIMAEYVAFTALVEKLGILRDSGRLMPTTKPLYAWQERSPLPFSFR